MKISCSPLRWIVRILPLALSVMLMACGGSSTSSSSGGGDAGASGTVIEFVSNSRDQLILQGQGGSETALVTFQVSNTLGEPLLGETVNFSLSSNVGGVSLASSASVETDGSGQASVVVQSGTVATTVHVIASVNGVEAVSSDPENGLSTKTAMASMIPWVMVSGMGPALPMVYAKVTIARLFLIPYLLNWVPVRRMPAEADKKSHKIIAKFMYRLNSRRRESQDKNCMLT